VSNSNHARALAMARSAPAPAPLADLLSNVLGRVAACLRAEIDARAARRRARDSVHTLMSLSNRELKDIGISRSEILSVVYGPAEGRLRSLDRRS
jgi:uncharacterized protein YjiS (DUF1127 family)